jgi:hypothetical protein
MDRLACPLTLYNDCYSMGFTLAASAMRDLSFYIVKTFIEEWGQRQGPMVCPGT